MTTRTFYPLIELFSNLLSHIHFKLNLNQTFISLEMYMNFYMDFSFDFENFPKLEIRDDYKIRKPPNIDLKLETLSSL